METGLYYGISNCDVSDTPSARPYYTAVALKETDVEYAWIRQIISKDIYRIINMSPIEPPQIVRVAQKASI